MRGLGVRSAIDLGLRAELMGTLHAGRSSSPSEPAAERTLDNSTLQELRATASLDWADLVLGSDPRFADLIPANGGSLADVAEALILTFGGGQDADQPGSSPAYGIPSHLQDAAGVRTWLTEVRNRISRIDDLPLENLLSDIVEHSCDERGRRRDALLSRLGWSGKPRLTLEEAGRTVGVTRERMRQLETILRRRLPKAPVYVPALSRALQLLIEAAPLDVDGAADLLHTRGVSGARFSPESVIVAAEDLGLEPGVRVERVRDVRLVTRAAGSTYVAAICRVARKKAGASGVVNAHDVAATVSAASGHTCSVEDVTTTLNASRRFRHLAGPWYWASDIPPGRNRLVNMCKRMLSVTSPISVTRLRDGLKREYMFRNLSMPDRFELRTPPAAILRDFLRDHPDFVVASNEDVRPSGPLDYRTLLSPFDQILVDVFRSSPSAVLDRVTILRECAERGASLATVSQNLTYGCLIEHLDTNIWTLRGSEVSPAAVEALRQANALRPKEKRVMDFGWTADGGLWVAALVPPPTQPFVFSCPGASRPYLAGQAFAAAMRDSTACGTLRVTDNGIIYGFNAFQQLSGCDAGDIVVVVFDLVERVATLMVGDEELLDRYSA